MTSFPILSVITFLPLFGVLFILFTNGEAALVARNARYVALWTSLGTLILSLYVWFAFGTATADFQFVEQFDWMRDFGIVYRMGVDGISLPFVLLSTVLTPICVLARWEAIETRVKEYMISFLVLETMMVWQLLQVKHMQDAPLILVGKMWPGLVEWTRTAMLTEDPPLASGPDLNIPICVATGDEAIAILRERQARWAAGRR